MNAKGLLLAVGLALGLLIVPSAKPVAAGSCPPSGQPYGTPGFAARNTVGDADGQGKYYAGWSKTSPGSPYGSVRADIRVMNPWVQPNGLIWPLPQFATGWVMLNSTTPNSNGGPWVQVGWKQDMGQTTSYAWYEAWSGWPSPPSDVNFGNLAFGGTPTFTVRYNGTPNTFDVFVSTNPSWTWNYANSGWTPDSAQIFGETTTVSSQMPGSIGDPETFANSELWIGTPGTPYGGWQNFAGVRSTTTRDFWGSSINYWGEWDDSSRNAFIADWACAPQPPGGKYNPITPARLWDTRVQGGRLTSGVPLVVQVTGQGGIPSSGVSAAVVNITVTGASGAGNISVVPYGMPQSQTSTLNYLPNQTISNTTEVAIGPGGKISIYAYGGATDVIVDAGGWVSWPSTAGSDGLFNRLAPARILDTRNGTGGRWTPLGPGETFALQVAGQGGVPSSGAAAVALNVTVTGGSAASYLVLWPDGSPRPPTSNVNFTAGQTLAHRDVVMLGSNGKIDILNAGGSVNVIVDVNGWYTDASGIQTSGVRFVPLNIPIRIYDSRGGSGPVGPGGQIGSGLTQRLHVGGVLGSPIPPSISAAPTAAVVLNVTVTNPTAASYLTIYADGLFQPSTSDINFLAGETRANMVVVGDLNDYIDIFNAGGSTDVIVDVLGFYA